MIRQGLFRTMVVGSAVLSLFGNSRAGAMDFPSFPSLPSLPSAPPLPGLPPAPSIPHWPSVPSLPHLPPAPTLPNPSDVEARINRARQDADAIHHRFDELKHRYHTVIDMANQARRLYNSQDEASFREVYRVLVHMGTIRSNRDEVLGRLRQGLVFFVPAKEFDHFEQVHLARAVAASVATANPGPAAQYVGQFLLESEQAFLRNFQDAPPEFRAQLAAEFRNLLLQALNAALNEGRVVMVDVRGFRVEVGIATIHHYAHLPYDQPELRTTGHILGVPAFQIVNHRGAEDVTLPNTFLPFFRAQIRIGAR